MLKTKKRIRRRLARNKNTPFENSIRTELKLVTNMTYNSIVNDYSTFWEKKFRNLKCDSNVFKNLKQLSSYKKRVNMPNEIFEDNNATPLIDDLNKANAFAKQFEKANNITLDMGSASFNQHVESTINTRLTNGPIADFSIVNQLEAANGNTITKTPFVKSSDVLDAINTRNNKKSAGNDKVSNFVLKKMALSIKFIQKITILLYHIINNSYMPKLWKEAIILPILKPLKDSKIVSSYRPISKLPSLAKVFEKIQANKIEIEIEDLKIDFDNQFGFRRGRTTCHI